MSNAQGVVVAIDPNTYRSPNGLLASFAEGLRACIQ